MQNEISLRCISETDTESILKWRNSVDVKKYFIYQKDLTRDDHLNWIKNMIYTNKAKQFIIHLNDLNVDVGSVYLRDINNENMTAEFGIYIGEKDFKGQGIGKLATADICEYGFHTLHLKNIFLRVFEDNLQAISSYKSSGFVVDVNRKEIENINGQEKSVIFMNYQNEKGDNKYDKHISK